MSRNPKCVTALVLCLAAGAAHAGVTYSFTGVVTQVTGAGNMLVGDYLTGTYTFTFDAADQTTGLVGVISPWAIGSSGIPYNPVFAYTAKIGQASFASSTSAPNSDPDDASIVSGSGWNLTAAEATPAFDERSFMTIEAQPGVTPYGGDGLPLAFSGRQRANGGINIGVVFISYRITSLSQGPAPPPAALFSTLLAAVSAVRPDEELAAAVRGAQLQFTQNNLPGACQALHQFIGEVRDADKRIAAAAAGDLVANAQALAATLGCVR